MSEPRIIRNRAKCLVCGDVVESMHVHDYRICSCGNLSVDGGLEYTKRGCLLRAEWVEMVEYAEEAEGE